MADLTEIEDLIEQLEAPIDWAHFVRDDHAMDYQELHMRAASALRQLLSATEWRDIKTAPKDGTPILLWAPDYFEDNPHAVVGEWCDRVGAWSSEVGMMEDGPIGDDPELCNGPSHWMPLPLPPSPDTEGE